MYYFLIGLIILGTFKDKSWFWGAVIGMTLAVYFYV